ncbi:D-3-phosphoglycerate dehydrogenase, partial [mine drainage metagenome]
IEGTVVLGEPRVMRIDGLRMNLVPTGSLLMLYHLDRPGLIGEMGQLLGQGNVNIAEMQVGRDAPRSRALTAVRVDDPVPPELAAQLRRIEGVESLHLVEL